MLSALVNLLVNGDYSAALRPLLGEEDSALVGSILSLTGR